MTKLVKFEFKDFPFPPSSNALYATIKKRRIKTVEARNYETECFVYALRFKIPDDELKKIKDKPLKVIAIIKTNKKNVLTKKGLLKKKDVSNQGKALFDQLAKLLQIDDCQFIEVSLKKIMIENTERQACDIFIEETRLS